MRGLFAKSPIFRASGTLSATLIAGMLATCASPHRTTTKPDAGLPDADSTDATGTDTGASDTGANDTGANDTGATDTSAGDTAKADTATADSATIDAAALDAATTDAATVDTADAGLPDEGTACFIGGPPGPGEKVKSPPKPSTSCPAFDEPFVGSPGDNLGTPTLKVEIGVLDAKTKAFTPLSEGTFVGFEPGAQPGFHIWLAFRVTIPGETAEQVNLEVGARGLIGCQPLGFGALPNFYANKDPKIANAYVFHHKLNLGFTLICQQKACIPADFCGQWYDVRLQVRQYQSNKWGKSQVLLRLWDGVTKK